MPTSDSLERLRRRRIKSRQASFKEAQALAKSAAITPALMAQMFKEFGCELPANIKALASELASDQRIFENGLTAAELERYSNQTAVLIGEFFRKGKNRGFPLVLNEAKTLGDESFGLGFPGGRVRRGESPAARLTKESFEETGLKAEVLDVSPVAEHPVGEEEHLFSAYRGRFIGGKPCAKPTVDEPITAIIFLDGETLFRTCQIDGRINVKIGREIKKAGILRSHRLVFMEYWRKQKQGQLTTKEATNV